MKQIFLGKPHQSIIDWINGHSYDPPTPPIPPPTIRAETRIWWSEEESDCDDYLLEGTIDETSLTIYDKAWNSAYKVEIGSAVTKIGDSAFGGCWPITSVTIPSSVMSIGKYAFSFCGQLMSITIPDSVMTIGSGAFESCENLTSVTIGSGIQEIGSSAFNTWGNPITLTIGKTVAEVQTMGNYVSTTNVPYSSWGLPSGSTIVCINNETIPIP